MDRNTVIGFILLAILLFVYLFISTKGTQDIERQRMHEADSIARIKRVQDSLKIASDTTLFHRDNEGHLQPAHTEQLVTVENDVLKATFTNKGGQPARVELKQYRSRDSTPVLLGGTDFDKISYAINTGQGQAAQVGESYFGAGTVTKGPGDAQVVRFTLPVAGGTVIHEFVIHPNSYLIDWNVALQGADKLLTQGALNLTWQSQPMQQERDAVDERQHTNVCFLEDNSFDYIFTHTSKHFEKPVQWVSVAQKFFNITLISKNPFTSGDIAWVREASDTSKTLAHATTTLQTKLPLGAAASVPMQLYFGPNDYRILRQQATDMDKIVNLGRDMYAFVRPINKYLVMPVFNLLHSAVGSLGIVILLLTLVIRLLTSPLVYTSYLSGAKMKALRPEIEKMKARVGNDQQQVGVEQMKLFREAGVNPLGGCIPALLQIPIFFALYSFFNSNIMLRGVPFLWSHDLSSYDSIVTFPFHIWGLGDHISLFTLLAVGTSFLISIYNMNSMTPDQNNPALKYMPYIFPFVLLFIFNKLPSALTWYYTVSNVITLTLQFVIQNYIIDHDKILARIDENRRKPKVKPKWQERFEQMQQQQKQLQDGRKKPPQKR